MYYHQPICNKDNYISGNATTARNLNLWVHEYERKYLLTICSQIYYALIEYTIRDFTNNHTLAHPPIFLRPDSNHKPNNLTYFSPQSIQHLPNK